MKILYNLFVRLLIFVMKIGAIFNYKLKKGLAGRRQSCDVVKSVFSPEDRVIWMHAASLGEYEQGLPVLEKLKTEFPEHKILVSFFSPSGYDNVIRKNHPAHAICYLPFDTEKMVTEFVNKFNADIFITVKYDFWYNLLSILKARNVKIYVISALFYETQVFFKAYGKWFVRQLNKNVDWFFHQTMHSTALAKSIGLKNSSTAGDTRYDRVKKLRAQNNSVPHIAEFVQESKVVVFGSSWESEERLVELLVSKNREVKVIIAPHDLKRVAAIRQLFPGAVLYSEFENSEIAQYTNAQILVIDCIGLLQKLYSYADVAVVGGGFHSKGLHNILEAAAFGIPVLFGDKFRKNPEAEGLIAVAGAKCFEDEFFVAPYLLELLRNDELRKQIGENARQFIDSQPNAAQAILAKILS